MRELRKHQRLALPFIRSRNHRVILGMAPGTGKTAVAIRTARDFAPVLILARRDDFMTWRHQLSLEYGNAWHDHWLFPIESGRHELCDVGLHQTFGTNWFMTTWDLLRNDTIAKWIKAQPFQYVIGDESHTIKRWEAERTKRAYRVTRHIPRRIAMTGTLITNEVMDVWSQAKFVDDGKTMGDNAWFFKKRYYLKLTTGYGWVPKRHAKDQVVQDLRPLVYSVNDSVLDLPPKVEVHKGMPMSPKQRQAYEDVLTKWELELANGDVLEFNHTIAQLQKLHQVANGFIYDDDHNVHEFDCPKLDAMISHIQDRDDGERKHVIWTAHTACINRVATRLRRLELGGVETFWGGMSRPERDGARTNFLNIPNDRFFVAQVDMGVGMNELVVADTAHYFSNSFKVVSKQQSMARTRRIGSEVHERITYYDWISEGTMEVKQLYGVRQMMSFAKWVMDQLRRGIPVRKVVTG